MKPKHIALLTAVICIVIVAGLFLPILFRPHGDTGAMNVGGWTKIGSVSDGYPGHDGSVFWATNQENGDRIYILIGGNGRGGIYVIPRK